MEGPVSHPMGMKESKFAVNVEGSGGLRKEKEGIEKRQGHASLFLFTQLLQLLHRNQRLV